MIDFIINPGEFRFPIEIKRSVIEKNTDGIPTEVWYTLLKTRSKIINGNGDEYSQALGTGAKSEKTFYIRYTPKHLLSDKDMIIYNNQDFNIKYINNIKEMNKYLEIRCKRVE